ncbi:GTP cyclohydrolase II [Acuticoccus sp. M5D2P5]|uniref:GTP cyclohydrolase II n=1 Tax=Acuticoccus kalidii TaxID=2910977 RepID=UPI001F3DC281|nr:GTP cyclohydrolase II [Acuticoccus kalidii]MCF3934201.1 GTP cyclohydrolase II [Acuticoccus kalidii]
MTPRRRIDEPGFIAAHRCVGEVGAGRPVILDDGTRKILVAPLDGGVVLSDTLAISTARASFLTLGEAPSFIRLPGADAAALMALASAREAELAGAEITEGGALASAATELAKLAERLPAMTVGHVDAAPEGTLSVDVADVLAFRRTLASTFVPIASAPVPLAAGATANVTAFRNAIGGCVSAVAVGDMVPCTLVRVHSSCVTGDIFGSLKCDCGAQLRLALDRIASDGGVLLYTAQEGRGIGLVNKLRAYALQDAGLDTVDANVALGYHDDERDYAAAAAVLARLGLEEVRLMTNNPAKAAGLESSGIRVTPVPLIGPVTPQNADYLATKRRRSGHRL